MSVRYVKPSMPKTKETAYMEHFREEKYLSQGHNTDRRYGILSALSTRLGNLALTSSLLTSEKPKPQDQEPPAQSFGETYGLGDYELPKKDYGIA